MIGIAGNVGVRTCLNAERKWTFWLCHLGLRSSVAAAVSDVPLSKEDSESSRKDLARSFSSSYSEFYAPPPQPQM
jgi:hypothetical protein